MCFHSHKNEYCLHGRWLVSGKWEDGTGPEMWEGRADGGHG